jgi:hypothetical protein
MSKWRRLHRKHVRYQAGSNRFRCTLRPSIFVIPCSVFDILYCSLFDISNTFSYISIIRTWCDLADNANEYITETKTALSAVPGLHNNKNQSTPTGHLSTAVMERITDLKCPAHFQSPQAFHGHLPLQYV